DGRPLPSSDASTFPSAFFPSPSPSPSPSPEPSPSPSPSPSRFGWHRITFCKAAIGETSANALRSLGWSVEAVADSPNPAALLHAIQQYETKANCEAHVTRASETGSPVEHEITRIPT